MDRFIFCCGLLCFFCAFKAIGQAVCLGDVVYLPGVHAVDYEQTVYKSARQINELVWPEIFEDLHLRVYYPSDLEPGELRPLIVLVHGGGFIGGSYSDFFDMAEFLASAGFIAASVQYRLCKRNDCLLAAGIGVPCNVSWGNSFVPSMYAAAVDVSDAIGWLVNNHQTYHIDTAAIGIAGYSAGAVTSLHVAFGSTEKFQAICSGCGLGSSYLSGTLTQNKSIKAVFSLAGFIADTAWISAQHQDVAVTLVHGTRDGAVSYHQKPVYPCCNTYSYQVYGACPVTEKLQQNGNPHYLITSLDYGHDFTSPATLQWVTEQLAGSMARKLVCDQPALGHTIMQAAVPATTCPPPLPNLPPESVCEVLPPGDQLQVVFGEQVNISGVANQSSGIVVVPTPANDFARIEMPEGFCREWPAYLMVYNSTGQLIHQRAYKDSGLVSINLADWPSGIYFGRVVSSLPDCQAEFRLIRK